MRWIDADGLQLDGRSPRAVRVNLPHRALEVKCAFAAVSGIYAACRLILTSIQALSRLIACDASFHTAERTVHGSGQHS